MTSHTVAKPRKFFSPTFKELFPSTVKSYLTFIQLKRIPSEEMKIPQQSVPYMTCCTSETLQIDLIRQLNSSDHRLVLITNDVATTFFFAVPLTNVRGHITAEGMTAVSKGSPRDTSTSFVPELLHDVKKLVEVQLEHSTLKHQQTVGVVDHSHGALKCILKVLSSEKWND